MNCITLLKLVLSLRYVSGNMHEIMICLLRFNEWLSINCQSRIMWKPVKAISYIWLATVLILARKDTVVKMLGILEL